MLATGLSIVDNLASIIHANRMGSIFWLPGLIEWLTVTVFKNLVLAAGLSIVDNLASIIQANRIGSIFCTTWVDRMAYSNSA